MLHAVLWAAGLGAALPCPAQESYSDPPRSGPYEFPLDEISKGMLLMTPRDRYRIGNRMRRSIENEATLRQTQIFWWKRQIHAESQFALDEATRARLELKASRRDASSLAPAAQEALPAKTASWHREIGLESGQPATSTAADGLHWPAVLTHPWFAPERRLIEARFITGGRRIAPGPQMIEVRRASETLALALRELVRAGRLEPAEYEAAKQFLDDLVRAAQSVSPAPAPTLAAN